VTPTRREDTTPSAPDSTCSARDASAAEPLQGTGTYGASYTSINAVPVALPAPLNCTV
jgi:hypothetical protein